MHPSLKQKGSLLTGLAVGLSALNLWAWSVLASRRDTAEQSRREVAVCQHLAEQIKILRQKPVVAGSQEMELTELSKRIEQAATGSGVPMAALIQISPAAAHRVNLQAGGESVYLEKPTTVLLSGVSLRQLAGFLFTMGSGPSAMDVKSLRISAPREEEVGDRWSAEITLSYLIYAPPPDPSSPAPAQTDISHSTHAKGPL